MPYIPHTEDDIKHMLDAIGANSIDDLFDEIPASLRIDGLPGIPTDSTTQQASSADISVPTSGNSTKTKSKSARTASFATSVQIVEPSSRSLMISILSPPSVLTTHTPPGGQ